MDQTVKKLWIEALTSNTYTQGRGRLKQNDRHCCLGVLCELYIQQTGKGRWEPENDFYRFILDAPLISKDSASTLLLEVREWAELTIAEEGSCLYYNDRQRLTFSQIADKLDKEVFEYPGEHNSTNE